MSSLIFPSNLGPTIVQIDESDGKIKVETVETSLIAMQFLAPDVLANIFDFLPWRDAIRLEALSSQFKNLPYKKKQVYKLEIEQTYVAYKDIVYDFIVCNKNTTTKRRKHLKAGQSKTLSLKGLRISSPNMFQGDSGGILETERQFFSAFIQYESLEAATPFFHRLFRRFTFSCIEIRQVDEEFFTDLGALNPDLFEQIEVTINTEEINFGKRTSQFLSQFKQIRFLNVKFYEKFEIFQELIWTLPCLQKGGQLRLECSSLSSAMNLNDEFLQQIIDRRFVHFYTNIKCFVSLDFLASYVQDCLDGKVHTIHYLELYCRRYANNELPIEFMGMGFKNCDKPWLKASNQWWEKEVPNSEYKEGYDPDKILLSFGYSHFKMSADFACYRGRKSLVRPSSHFYITQ